MALKTLLFSDLVGSTRLVEKLGDRRAARLFARHDRLARDLLVEHDGQEIDKTDGFLLLFKRPLAAVRYALSYHRAVASLAREKGTEVASRVGIHLGEVFLRPNPPEDVARGAKPLEVEGLAKPMAARLMSLAGERQTLLTRAAFDLARRAAVSEEPLAESLHWLAHGEYRFEGVEEPVGVFEVGFEGLSPLAPPPDSAKARRASGEDAILGWRPAAGQEIATRPHWQLTEKLGEGGFGEVWLARHRKTGERRVLKFCFDARRLRALQREITLFRLLKEELGERRDIARILDWSFERLPYFIESEYTAGGSLVDWAQAQGGIAEVPLERRLEIVAQVAEALSAAHSVGVLHKDVKPGNVLIHTDATGRVQARLADFGVGGVTDEERLAAARFTVLGMTQRAGATKSGSTSGTRLYHAPELIEGKAATVQADIYALGVMLYQMVVGDLYRAIGPGWERGVDDPLLREDIAISVDVDPKKRLGNALRLAERLRSLPERREVRERERREKEEAERTRAALERSRRQRRVAAVVLTLLLVFGAVVTALWRQSEAAFRRGEASKLLALGRLNLDRNPSLALAYALASLELADDSETRLFALEVLWRGPVVNVVQGQSSPAAREIVFSPDGKWLAWRRGGFVELQSRDGGGLRTRIGDDKEVGQFRFGPRADLLLTGSLKSGSIRFWSVPEGELLRSLEVEALVGWELTAGTSRMITVSESDGTWLVRSWPLTGGQPTPVGEMEKEEYRSPRIDPTATWLVFESRDGQSLYVRRIDGAEPARLLGRHDDVISSVSFSPDGRRIASGDRSGDIRIWPLSSPVQSAARTLTGHRGKIASLVFDSKSQRLASPSWDGTTRIWDLTAPPEADPLVIKGLDARFFDAAFHPNGKWLAIAADRGVTVWSLSRPYARILRGYTGAVRGVTFSPDGSWVASSSADGTLRLWPLAEDAGEASRVLFRAVDNDLLDVDVDPDGRFLLVGSVGRTNAAYLVPVGGGRPRVLEGSPGPTRFVALGPKGRFAAATARQANSHEGVLRIWDLESGDVRSLDPGNRTWIGDIRFTPQGRLLTGGFGSIRSWRLADETFEIVREGREERENRFSMSSNGRFLASCRLGGDLEVQDLQNGSSWKISSHGRVSLVALNATGTMLVTADELGRVRVGPVTGEAPHVLLGHETVDDVAVSPDGRWIASGGSDGTLRLWPKPEGQPFHTLPYEEFLDRLRALTNIRIVEDERVQGGYGHKIGPFRGWESVPTW